MRLRVSSGSTAPRPARLTSRTSGASIVDFGSVPLRDKWERV